MTMSSVNLDPPSQESAHPAGGDKDKLPSHLKKLLWWFVPGVLGIYTLWGAIPGILLPLQVTGIDPANKVANLAVVTTIGALAAMLAQPIAGVISDRTRTKFGRRAPWMVLGTLVGSGFLILLGTTNALWQIVLLWTLVQISYNFAQGPLTAVMPDRVPPKFRGTFSAVIGAATMIAGLGGTIVAAVFSESLPTGFLVFAGLSILTTLLFVLFNPDTSSKSMEVRPFELTTFLKAFWVNPKEHPDFIWAIFGRFLLYAGYFAIMNYNLFLLQDYVGLGAEAVKYAPLVMVVALPFLLISISIAGPWSDRVGQRKPFIFAAAAIVAVAQLIPFFMPSMTGMFLYAAISGFGFGAFQAVDNALVTEVLPASEDAGKDLGIVNIAATLPQTIAPALGGSVVLLMGYQGLFPVAAVLSVLGGISIYMIKSVK